MVEVEIIVAQEPKSIFAGAGGVVAAIGCGDGGCVIGCGDGGVTKGT